MDTHLLSNIQKLFSERIDIFSPVEFNKVRSWVHHHVPKHPQRPQTAHLPSATCPWCQGSGGPWELVTRTRVSPVSPVLGMRTLAGDGDLCSGQGKGV